MPLTSHIFLIMENYETAVLTFLEAHDGFAYCIFEILQEMCLMAVFFTEACELSQNTQKWPKTPIHTDKEHPMTVLTAHS